MFPVSKSKPPETLSRPSGLEHTLGDNETQFTPWLQIKIGCDVSQEYGHIILALSENCFEARMFKQAVPLPDVSAPPPIFLGEALPVYPRRIPHNEICLGHK